MKKLIQFSISKSDGYYVAEAVDFPIVTQAKTFEELIPNVKEAVEVYLQDEDSEEIGVIKDPSLLINFEISAYA
ncbi:MAG: type II toxin-antitoxin system HicB family antitoxin [bacterium]|nr:type II toxin-antitoxin system HicB family antitoxin [bacterium]